MGLPDINLVFHNAATTAIARSQRGIVGAILKDSAPAVTGAHELLDESQIPAELSAVNQDYLKKTFIGYVNKPQKVIAYVLNTDAADLNTALDYFALHKIDYLVGPVDCSTDEAQAISDWIKTERENKRTPKAVLPNTAADNEGIINFTSSAIKTGDTEYTTAGYCGRIAGLIAGTPIAISSTYAQLPEVTDVNRLTEAEMDTAIDNGEFIIFHDGEKVKCGRGVNSLKTTTTEKGEAFKKIKIVEAVDMMEDDIRMTVQDNYIGKYSNSYDNKCLLISAIQDYFMELESEGVLQAGNSTVGIDIAKQKTYLQENGKDVIKMSEQEIKKADTGSHVFLSGSVGILDTIEDIDLDISF